MAFEGLKTANMWENNKENHVFVGKQWKNMGKMKIGD
jgi:hypothetical protein